MTITLHTTSYGGPATELLRARVAAAKADSPLTPVTIVVPSNFVGVAVRRDLAADAAQHGRGGIVGLGILTIYRLAELLGAAALAAEGRRPVSTPVIGAAIRQVLDDQPGLFHPVADHPATEASLVRVFRELSDCTPAALDTLAASSERASEVVRVHRGARQRLQDDWYDEADLMASAARVAATSTVVDDLGTILLHMPQRLSPAAAGLVLALGKRAPIEVLAGLTGHEDADLDVRRCLARLDLDVPAAAGPAPVAVTRIVSVSDADEEARSAIGAVIEAARRGVPLERMAITYPSREPYGRILTDHLDAAGIRWNGQAVRPLSQRLAGRWLLDLLDLVDGRWSRPQVLGLYASAPLRQVQGHVVRVASWERISREAGIVEGRDSWGPRLQSFADRRRAEAEHEEGRDPQERRDWLVDRHRQQADVAEELAEVVAALDADLSNGQALRTWRELADWASWMLATHLGHEPERTAWPDEEQDAAQKVEAALDRLAALDAIEPKTDVETFGRALELELDADLERHGRFGEGVLVGPVAVALGVNLDLVVVLGMAEGVLPTRPREDSLLADADRETVADQLPPRAQQVGTEHRQVLAALAAASDQRVLVHPRGDLRRSIERAPSRWLLDAIEDVTGERRLEGGPIEVVPSFAGRLGMTAFPADHQSHRLASLRGDLGLQRLDAGRARAHDDRLVPGAQLLDGRGGSRFTRFNGDLATVAELVQDRHGPARQLSASRVESYLACPHGYLVQYVLGVDPVENPEEQLEVSPLDRGSLVHTVLEDWLGEQIAGGTVPAPGRPWGMPARERLDELAESALDDLAGSGVVGHPVLWRGERGRILADLRDFPEHDDRFRAERGATPTHVEAPFGLAGADDLAVELGDGRSLRFRGMIDRIDRTRDGAIIVTDYKTGSSREYQGLSAEDPDASGGNLQLMLYALAARQIVGDPQAPVHARYWFTSAKGKWGEVGYDVDDTILERLRHVLRTVADQIAAGVFPQRPAAPAWRMWTPCHYCDPDELGTAFRFREWERLVTAPQLADYLAIVEPDLGVAP